jgi:creatinine amidohydrolase
MLYDWQNTSFEVRDGRPSVAVLPIGGTERNGDHLPVGAMNFILDVLSRRVAESLTETVYLLPTFPLGSSEHLKGQPGTVSLEYQTLYQVVYDITESLLEQGIRRVAIINGLGGASETTVRPRENYIVKTAARQPNYDYLDLDAIWVQPFTVAKEELLEIMGSAREDVHAGELATSLMLHLDPETVKGSGADFVPNAGKEFMDFVAFDRLTPSGVWGRPSLATADKGKRALDAAVMRTTEYIERTFAQLVTMKRRMYYPTVKKLRLTI